MLANSLRNLATNRAAAGALTGTNVVMAATAAKIVGAPHIRFAPRHKAGEAFQWAASGASPRLQDISPRRRPAVSLRCLQRSHRVPDMVTALCKHGDLIFACEPLNLTQPLDRAIRQVGNSTLDWLRERGHQPADQETSEHVGIVVADANGHATSVVEAVRLLGVRSLSLEGFFAEFVAGTKFFRGRVEGVTDEQRKRAVAFALSHSGAPYSHDFSPPDLEETEPLKQAYYCSSLVDYAYRSALKKDLVFTDEPFPLMFEPRSYWEGYYNSQNLTVPSGYGSNPTLLMHSPRVRCAELDLHDVEEECHEMF